MQTFYKNDPENRRYASCSEDDAEFVMIDIQTFHGMQKAVRIVRDRAMQQIDKAKADVHGYTLVRAVKKKEIWSITKSTPYSIKIPFEEASAMIEMDMRSFYWLRAFPDQKGESPYDMRKRCFEDMVRYINMFDAHPDYITDWRKTDPNLMAFLEESDFVLVDEPESYSTNLAKGVYEVTYRANKCI